ncbi:MAG: hypothetical protein OEL56_03655 [Nitrosopumilus sp.]|nr:hypothetical protein [Nitrosopumilus sp.]MDH3489522.1 hypothetical protein [Nitrosopumilus sp.]MDH3516520.1 hypothetical protein [Nitrosopumilus sp.]MDH3564986.1 hypothetical protein [Nitrosopumilus sp.]MDH5416409.1 hypothetical protein [Nitrosopumilus sp.]
MSDCAHTWRKKLRLQKLMIIARKELKSGKDVSQVYKILDEQMSIRWRFVSTTKKQYLDDVTKILTNQYVLNI